MPDSTLWTTMISTGGALAAGLGGVALTFQGTIRREERQGERRREEQRVLQRKQAYADLLGTAAMLRVRVRTASQRHWPDMNLKLTEIQEHAAAFNQHAWGVALLSPAPVAEAAHTLTKAADGLVSHVVKNTQMGSVSGPDVQFAAGTLDPPADFSAFEDGLADLREAITADVHAGCPPIEAQPSPGRSSGP